jgi:hypothetical protein
VIVLTLYSRPECHLCEEMLAELMPVVAGRARIEIVDITDDEALHARYLLEIPVLAHRDRELSRHRLDRAGLERFFDERTA